MSLKYYIYIMNYTFHITTQMQLFQINEARATLGNLSAIYNMYVKRIIESSGKFLAPLDYH